MVFTLCSHDMGCAIKKINHAAEVTVSPPAVIEVIATIRLFQESVLPKN